MHSSATCTTTSGELTMPLLSRNCIPGGGAWNNCYCRILDLAPQSCQTQCVSLNPSGKRGAERLAL